MIYPLDSWPGKHPLSTENNEMSAVLFRTVLAVGPQHQVSFLNTLWEAITAKGYSGCATDAARIAGILVRLAACV